MQRYFNVQYGYDKSERISVNDLDVEKAIYAMITGNTAHIADSFISGKHIISITEDWNKTMGYNPTHKLESDDWNEIESKGVRQLYSGFISGKKQEIQQLISEGKQNLIGTPRESNLLN